MDDITAVYPPLLTADEMASLLRTSRKVIYEMTSDGKLPGATRIGRRLLYRRSEVVAWLRESSVASCEA